MKKWMAAAGFLFLGLFPIACQKTFTVGPLPAFTPTPTVTATSTPCVRDVSEADFTGEVLNSAMPVMVEFFATWCPHCQAFAPIVDQFAQDYAGRIKVVRVDIDLNPNLVSSYHITGVPTSVFIRNGTEVVRVVGGTDLAGLSLTADGFLASGP